MKYIPEKREIDLRKKITNALDKFALDFLGIIKKHTEYVVISGYVSILLGRSRATEDIDVFIKKITKEQFLKLYQELLKEEFWCINEDNGNELFEYLGENMAIRFCRKNSPIPNFEIKFPKDSLDEKSFKDSINVLLSDGEIKISSLERHIAFKEIYLGSEKDIEDSEHIRELFKESLDYEKINKLKELVRIRKEHERKKAEKNFYETW